MNKTSKILLLIITILVIALGVMTYYYFYMRNRYILAATELIKINNAINEKGYIINSQDNGKTYIIEEPDGNFLFSTEGE